MKTHTISFLKSLVLASLISSPLTAKTNKTFLMPRPTGVHLPMEYSAWEALVNRNNDRDFFGGQLQAVAFYEGSSDNGDTAKYFGVHNKGSFTARTDLTTFGANISPITNDIDLGYFMHDYNNQKYSTATPAVAVNKSAQISLKPHSQEAGVRFDYYQNLDCLAKGLFAKVNIPVVCVEHNLNLRVGNVTVNGSANSDLQNDIVNFFSGNYAIKTDDPKVPGDAQVALTKAMYTGHQSETDVADIDLSVGYSLIQEHQAYLSLALAITIPTGNSANGTYLFEPIVGNGQHFALGGNLEGMVNLWDNSEATIDVLLKINYRYLFEHAEHRTLGLNTVAGAGARDWGQYYLLGKVSAPSVTPLPSPVALAKNQPLVPAANLTTLHVDVTPGSQMDGMLGLEYNNKGWVLDLGYNLYVREAETLHLHDVIEPYVWALAARNANMIGANDADRTAETNTAAPLTNNNLVITAAQTSSQITHAIYGNVGYVFKDTKCPIMVGIGGDYEFASSNSALEQWMIHGRLGIGF